MENENLLAAQGLVKAYAGTPALSGVDFAIHAGESIAIMGASGSGKTTLLHCLAGIVPADEGSIVLSAPGGPVQIEKLGRRERAKLRREAFGFVFQQGLLIPELTALENVALPLMLNGMARSAAEGRAADWLAALGLMGAEGRRIGQLSGGQAQRVAIARAQITGAAIVFADEPTGALDSTTSREVMDTLVGSTVEQGRALLVVTHDESVAARCGRTVRIVDGRILAEQAMAR